MRLTTSGREMPGCCGVGREWFFSEKGVYTSYTSPTALPAATRVKLKKNVPKGLVSLSRVEAKWLQVALLHGVETFTPVIAGPDIAIVRPSMTIVGLSASITTAARSESSARP